MNAVAVAESLQAYATAHDRLGRDLPGGTDWQARRASALERLMRLGLPTSRDEAWKYTPLRLLEQNRFEPARADNAPDLALTREIDAGTLSIPGARRLTFLDGRFQPALSDEPAAIDDVRLEMLADALHTAPDELLARIPPASERPEDRFALLNEAFLSEGVTLRVPEGSTPAPLQLQFIAGADGRSRHPRVLIEVENGAHVQVIEQHHFRNAGHVLSNGITNIRLHRGAVLEHYLLLDPHADAPAALSMASTTQLSSPLVLHGTYSLQGSDSRLVHHRVMLGGQLTRASLQVRLEERGAAVELNSLALTPASEYADAHSVIEHRAPATRSAERFRAAAGKGGRCIFNGRIVVRPGAPGSDSQQSSRGLLLEPGAEIDSRPQLEIYTDDVKCSHGATTGRLDPDMLFYLLSRGLDAASARDLLIFAFLDDVVARMGLAAVRRHLEQRIAAALPHSPVIRELL